MIRIDYKALVSRLNEHSKTAFSNAAGLCVSYTHYDIDVEHLFYKLIDGRTGDICEIFKLHGVEIGRVEKIITGIFENMKSGNGNMPGLSQALPKLLKDAWMIASIEYGSSKIRSSHILIALMQEDANYPMMSKLKDEFKKMPLDDLKDNLYKLIKDSSEGFETYDDEDGDDSATPAGGAPAKGKASKKALNKFCIDLTAQAKEGKIDPIVGRDSEIRDAIDILIRRRKNNPLFIGEAGVGKTAVVEGMALRIANGDVPDNLKEVSLLSLDLGALQAGAGVRGEFEKRLKEVIKEVQASPKPIILFVDEIHTLMGAGGKEGAGDAANLLKPALARGELRTIGATTLAEHKQFIAKDAALDRRFQTVYVDEPDIERAIKMMRSIVPSFEKHHNVRILEEAVHSAVTLGSRYISGRQLPDKSVDLIDTACARVALAMAATPPELEDAKRKADHLDLEITRLERETAAGDGAHEEKTSELKEERAELETKITKLDEKWHAEKEIVDAVRGFREDSEKAEDDAARDKIQANIKLKIEELEKVQAGEPLVHINVDAQAVAGVVSSWTGVPVGKMVSDEMEALLNIGDNLKGRVKGQDHALSIIADNLRTSRYNLSNPDQPIGIFLLVGPSGVGKTETALALSDMLFGGEKNIITINMSEFKEQHSSSRLIGPPPGYVGFGKGGMLTEKVRNRPYSVVLLDEIEKAHYDVREFFQQVFDKGYLADSEGQIANFRNTVMIMTANVGDNAILNACFEETEEGGIVMKENMPSQEELKHILMPELLKTFSSSLLARMSIVPYYPLTDDVLEDIIRLKLDQVSDRLKDNHKINFKYNDEVVDLINSRCNEVQSGARNVNRIVNGAILPKISSALIEELATGGKANSVEISIGEDGDFKFDVN